MMKSSVDTAVPARVLTVNLPEPVDGGTGSVTVVELTPVGDDNEALKRLGLLAGDETS
jgi:hypothetical protein